MSIKKTLIEDIPVERIYVGKGAIRTRQIEADLDGLIKNIKRFGLLYPLIVSQKDDKYELIVGQRRLLAVKALGWKKVPAIIIGRLDVEEAKVLSLIDNVQRKDLSYADLMDAIEALYAKYGSTKSVAENLGVSQAMVRNWLPLSLAPKPIKEMIEKRKIKLSEARKILMIAGDDERKMMLIAKEMQKMTVPEKRRLIDLSREKPRTPAKKLIEEVKKPAVETKLVIHLGPKFKQALDKAAKDLGMDSEDVFKTIIIDWLTRKGYGE